MTDDRFTESGYLIATDVEGWVTTDPESQMFARINMTKPVERSMEVLTHSSFDVYLNDLDGGKWYFIPENSDAGPLEDILQLYFWGLAFLAGITHIKLPGSKQRTILDESHRSISHGCRQPSNQAHKTISRRGELAAPGSGGGFHHVCTPFKLLRARTSPLVASLHL